MVTLKTAGKFPTVIKSGRWAFRAVHHLAGVSSHADASELHEHEWQITLEWRTEYPPNQGFSRDETELEAFWGSRVAQLDGANLSAMLDPLPATAENVALWLLCYWLPRLTPNRLNFEVSAITVSKCDQFTARVQCNRAATEWARAAWGEP